MGVGPVTALALPPYDSSSTVFRAAVYTTPETVRLRVGVHGPEHVDLLVTDMLPGMAFSVRGPVERPWEALLTCRGTGWFTVSRAPAAPPDGG